jgi:hypothetical protein
MNPEHNHQPQTSQSETNQYTELDEFIGQGTFLEVRKSEQPGYVEKQVDPFMQDLIPTGDKTPELMNEYLKRLRDPDNHVAEHVALGQVEGSDLESFKLHQERIAGEPLTGHIEDGERVPEITDTERQEIVETVHGLLQIYSDTFGPHEPINGPIGAIGEFEKLDSYMRGRNEARGGAEGIYFVDIFPPYMKDPEGVIDSLDKFCRDFGVDPEDFKKEYAELKRLDLAA